MDNLARSRSEVSRIIKLRAHRIDAETARLDDVIATFRVGQGATITAGVVNLSLRGARIRLRQSEVPEVLLRTPRFEVCTLRLGEQILYDGAAVVRRANERDGLLELGLELESPGVQLDAVYETSTVLDFGDRLRNSLDRGGIEPAFVELVAELRSFLWDLKVALDTEEARIVRYDRESRDRRATLYVRKACEYAHPLLDGYFSRLTEIVGHFDARRHSVHRAYYASHLHELLHHSPFMHRVQHKPLGYSGDYEMMSMIYRRHDEGTSLFARVLNRYATECEAAQAVVHRADLLAHLISERTAFPGTTSRRVASIGSGPARELELLFSKRGFDWSDLEVLLIDQEELALEYCERTLAPKAAECGAKLTIIHESVRRLLGFRELHVSLAGCGLIYSAGLFDYLNDKTFTVLARLLFEPLAPGGALVIGNFAPRNSSRWFMEYSGEWFLNYRTHEQLLELVKPLTMAGASATVETEATGVNLFLVLKK